jgi:hypothetical protein
MGLCACWVCDGCKIHVERAQDLLLGSVIVMPPLGWVRISPPDESFVPSLFCSLRCAYNSLEAPTPSYHCATHRITLLGDYETCPMCALAKRVLWAIKDAPLPVGSHQTRELMIREASKVMDSFARKEGQE